MSHTAVYLSGLLQTARCRHAGEGRKLPRSSFTTDCQSKDSV